MGKNRKEKVIIFGSLNTDIIAYGVEKFLGQGQQTIGGVLKIGPGGKSRNIASMVSVLLGRGKVVMVGKTVKDPFNLWKVPFEALKKSGVITDFIDVLEFNKVKKFPGVAIIPVDKKGRNQIYVLPGVNEDFSKKDIDRVEDIFAAVSLNEGVVCFTLEMPFETSCYIMKKSKKYKIKVVIDPGGIQKGKNYKKLLEGSYFLKPNEFEAEILTGIKVKDFNSAKKAGEKILNYGVENVLITCGEKGGYFFSKGISRHIKIPQIKVKSREKDETGCGDQVTAGIIYGLVKKKDIMETVKEAIIAGSLQFYRKGIVPVRKKEMEETIRNLK